MTLSAHPLYREDVRRVANAPLPWEKLKGAYVVLSGATGLLGRFLADVLMEKNREGLGCEIVALGRSRERFEARFGRPERDSHLTFERCDLSRPEPFDGIRRADVVLHLASNTHPLQYATDPIGTITTNLTGLHSMLELACRCGARRFAFASSNEIYGENRGDTELFDEHYCGYIDCNTLRAGYPESKRCGEALCQAYRVQRGLDVVIPRFTRSYGPTMLPDDSKAISQFIRKGVAGEDIVLKSQGLQNYSYTYVADAVSGLLTVLLLGDGGSAYNIADEASNIRLKDLAALIADWAGTRVTFDLPDAVEAAGYSRATTALLDARRLKALGWTPRYDIREGIVRTLKLLRETQGTLRGEA